MALNAQSGSRFRNEMVDLRQSVLEMGGLAEEALSAAIDALLEGDRLQAERGRDLDEEIDRLERVIDERCLKILALHQPAASELRFVTMAMRLATDLERVGGLARNLAKRAAALSVDEAPTSYAEIPKLTGRVRQMMSSALDAFVDRDVDLAWDVLRRDDEVDAMHRDIQGELQRLMEQERIAISQGLVLLFVVKDLERIADHATSIAEGVIFMVRGRDARAPDED